MICLIALIVFAILAIFSVSYRPLAKEAFECVWLKTTFRKCKGSLDLRIKSYITAKFMKISPSIAKILYKYFEIFSWMLVLLMIISFIYSGISVYNLVAYGNCNGEDSNDICVFNPLATKTVQDSCIDTCKTPECFANPQNCSADCDCTKCGI